MTTITKQQRTALRRRASDLYFDLQEYHEKGERPPESLSSQVPGLIDELEASDLSKMVSDFKAWQQQPISGGPPPPPAVPPSPVLNAAQARNNWPQSDALDAFRSYITSGQMQSNVGLAQMVEVDLIIRYEADGKSLIQLTDWWEWQHGLRHREPSRYPAPEGWEDQVSEGAQRDTGGRFSQKPKGPTPPVASRPAGEPEVACPECGTIGPLTKSGGLLLCSSCRYCLAERDGDGRIRWAPNVKVQ